MQVERSSRNLRARDDKASLAKRDTPAKAKKTISAASLFKQTGRKTKQINDTPSATRKHGKGGIEAASATKSVISVRSLPKVQKRATKRRLDMHPLAVAFKDSSNDYRRNLYTTTSQKINKTLESLLHRLHESTMQTVFSQLDSADPHISPLKLTAPAKYERMTARLYQPLSQYKLTLSANDRQGERIRFEATLETRMQDYEDHLARCAEEVARLQEQWEAVVGEIWKLGVTCLGEDSMEQLLLTQGNGSMIEDLASDVTRVESSLFVNEQGSSSPARESRGKKRVTFKTPSDQDKTGVDLAFLSQPSRYKKDTLLLAPPLPEQDVRGLTKEIKELGKREMEELQEINKEKQQFWKRKTNQIMKSLVEE
ncbi:hypothetical protein NX059_009001 [Plenodomus lindquistii]|nr:hypothetical protein NX059_009001 [Plenodomus lindquistii]